MVWGPAPAAGGGCSDVSIRKVSFMPSTPASCNGHRRRQAPQRLSATESGQSTRSVDRPVGHCALCTHCVLYMVHYALCIVHSDLPQRGGCHRAPIELRHPALRAVARNPRRLGPFDVQGAALHHNPR